MNLRHRLRSATRASVVHLAISALVASICAILVFYVWYPYPYSKLVGGRDLFLIVVAVDVVSGPLLTLVVFSDQKKRAVLARDIGLIAMVQLAALSYGLHSVLAARPVFLAFEGDRFRVVTVPEVDIARLQEAPVELRHFSLTGPKPIAAALAKSDDPAFLESIRLSVSGLHPAFRPSRWRPYEGYKPQILGAAMPLTRLREKYPAERQEIDRQVTALSQEVTQLGYLPLIAGHYTDWVVVVDLESAEPRSLLPLDGW